MGCRVLWAVTCHSYLCSSVRFSLTAFKILVSISGFEQFDCGVPWCFNISSPWDLSRFLDLWFIVFVFKNQIWKHFGHYLFCILWILLFIFSFSLFRNSLCEWFFFLSYCFFPLFTGRSSLPILNTNPLLVIYVINS